VEVEVEVEGREEVVVLDQDLGQVMVLGLDPGAVKDMVLVVMEEVEAEAEAEAVAVVEAKGQVLAMGPVAAQAMVQVVG
jgi:hypothetical protein